MAGLGLQGQIMWSQLRSPFSNAIWKHYIPLWSPSFPTIQAYQIPNRMVAIPGRGVLTLDLLAEKFSEVLKKKKIVFFLSRRRGVGLEWSLKKIVIVKPLLS